MARGLSARVRCVGGAGPVYTPLPLAALTPVQGVRIKREVVPLAGLEPALP